MKCQRRPNGSDLIELSLTSFKNEGLLRNLELVGKGDKICMVDDRDSGDDDPLYRG
jgi:hypothetical protein